MKILRPGTIMYAITNMYYIDKVSVSLLSPGSQNRLPLYSARSVNGNKLYNVYSDQLFTTAEEAESNLNSQLETIKNEIIEETSTPEKLLQKLFERLDHTNVMEVLIKQTYKNQIKKHFGVDLE